MVTRYETIEIPEAIYLQILKKVSTEKQKYGSVTDLVIDAIEKELLV